MVLSQHFLESLRDILFQVNGILLLVRRIREVLMLVTSSLGGKLKIRITSNETRLFTIVYQQILSFAHPVGRVLLHVNGVGVRIHLVVLQVRAKRQLGVHTRQVLLLVGI